MGVRPVVRPALPLMCNLFDRPDCRAAVHDWEEIGKVYQVLGHLLCGRTAELLLHMNAGETRFDQPIQFSDGTEIVVRGIIAYEQGPEFLPLRGLLRVFVKNESPQAVWPEGLQRDWNVYRIVF